MFRSGSRKAFSLVEVVVVLALVGILGAVSTLCFNRMSRQAEGEREIRDLQATLFSARLMSVQQRRRHGVRFEGSRYAFLRYSSEDEPEAGGEVLALHPLALPVADGGGESLEGVAVAFDTRGLSRLGRTIRLADENASDGTDCIAVSWGRVNAGKMKGESCVAK